MIGLNVYKGLLTVARWADHPCPSACRAPPPGSVHNCCLTTTDSTSHLFLLFSLPNTPCDRCKQTASTTFEKREIPCSLVNKQLSSGLMWSKIYFNLPLRWDDIKSVMKEVKKANRFAADREWDCRLGEAAQFSLEHKSAALLDYFVLERSHELWRCWWHSNFQTTIATLRSESVHSLKRKKNTSITKWARLINFYVSRPTSLTEIREFDKTLLESWWYVTLRAYALIIEN